MVLFFCDEFRELPNLTRDLSQAKKKITVVTSWATHKMKTISSQNDNLPPRVSICILVLNSERILERHYFLFKLPSSPSVLTYQIWLKIAMPG